MTRDQQRRVRNLTKRVHDGAVVTGGFKDGRVEVVFPPDPHKHRVAMNRRKAPRAFKVVNAILVLLLVVWHLGGGMPLTPTGTHVIVACGILGMFIGLWEGWPATRRKRLSIVDVLLDLAELSGIDEFKEFKE